MKTITLPPPERQDAKSKRLDIYSRERIVSAFLSGIMEESGGLIEAGYDIINPVQTSAHQMDPETLRREFGRNITFWGDGCNIRTVLNCSTPEEVCDYARRMIDIFASDGGFVFNQEHNILPDVPPENILAMYRAVADARG